MPETPMDEMELAIVSFLRVSGAYLLSCAYRESLRAAYARHAAQDPLVEQEMNGNLHRPLSLNCNAAVIN